MKNRMVIIFSIVFSFSLFSQESKLKRADEKYNNYAYINAVSVYEKIAKKGYTSPDMLKKIGNSYYFNADFKNAAKWYEELFKLNSEVESEYLYRYSQCLKSNGDYVKADEYLEKFSTVSDTDSRAQFFKDDKKYLNQIEKLSNRYTIEDAGVNTVYSDYGGTVFNENFIFTTVRDTGSVSKNIHTWSNQAFSNLYSASISPENELSEVSAYSKKLKSKFHESSIVFTNDGSTVYFTRNNFLKGKKGKNEDGVILLKIYRASLVNGKWSNIQQLPFNSDEYNVAHPSLSADNKTLYFASDMPGTLGASDIFKVSVNSDGTFGTPENLGNKINTEGRETFPFISKNNELFFASNGHLGLGGLDVFVIKFNDDGSTSKIYNVGTPVNSPADDFGYIVNNETKRGFVSSNRAGGKGDDDIYKFLEQIPLPFNANITFEGKITDAETKELMPNVKVVLFDEGMNKVGEILTDENGNFSFDKLEGDKQFFVRAQKDEFEIEEKGFVTNLKNETIKQDVALVRNVNIIDPGADLAKEFNVKIIYFDSDKFNIRKDAAVELAKIIKVMKEFPTMKVDVRSHCDSRQTSFYNEKLSDKRAKSTIAWLIENGIEAERLTGKGYGESQLINECKNGVKCSSEKHQENRRSEFIIIEI